MRFEIDINYDTLSIIKGSRAYCLRKFRQDLILSPLFLLAIFSWTILSTENRLFVGFLFAISLIYFIIVYGLCFITPYRSARKWEKAGLKTAKWTFDEDNIQAESEIGQTSSKWSNISELWLTKDIWLFVYHSGAHSSLPISVLSEEQCNFIKHHVLSHGGKVK